MKHLKNLNLILSMLIVFGLASSCRKDNITGMPIPGKGAPTISSVHTLSKTDTTAVTRVVTTYNSSGVASTTIVGAPAKISAFDSTTVSGVYNNYYVLYGTNLASTTKILINGVSIYFNRGLISDNSLIFSIPTTVPYLQPQSNTIQVITLNGSVTYGFTTLPPTPAIASVSDYNFSGGSQITLTGQGFVAVTAVTLQATKEAVTIVSKTDNQLVIKMPSSTTNRSVLSFAYTSGTKMLNVNSTIEFVNIDKAYAIFANGNFQNNWQDNSYAQPAGPSASAPSITGKGSIVASYPAGGYKVEGEANYYPSFAYDPSYKYLTFWIKGGTVNHTLFLVGDQLPGGFGNSLTSTTATPAQIVVVPANVWTYYKIPLGTGAKMLAFWGTNPTTATLAKQLGFFLRGSSGDVNETMYVDEILFVK
ncbi:IPT/TIG domain-containing protein [uncultured Mucilaginibacter sp.]|uniref:IPT/TIG domain-containing protein n=1 Tax=uncultured Mucilaginibacter sp. TaxID=797541 RepID=UPI002624A486|nr:IPT/TIG domain-containing protein [uncultured Mucilaginibacter sp.]